MTQAAKSGPVEAAAQPRGAFIVLEGADRAGKTTQCARLVEHLRARGLDARLWRFPDRATTIGRMIDAYLKSQAELDDAAVHLLFSANRWEKRDELLRALAEGATLVVDRYAYSGVAFTAAKEAPGLDLAWCQAPDAGLPAPDAVFFLDLSPEAAAARGGYGEERYEKAAFQEKVLRQFRAMAAADPGNWRVVDAGRSVDEVAAELAAAADAAVDRVQAGGAPLRTLWQGSCGGAAAAATVGPKAALQQQQQQQHGGQPLVDIGNAGK